MTVEHNDNRAEHLSLLVVSQDGPSLLSRNWLRLLKLDWSVLHKFHNSRLQEILNRHSVVFGDDLETLKGFQAHIYVDPTVPLRFHKACSVPNVKRNLVDELENLQELEIIKLVEYSNCAAPIVPILNQIKYPSGSVGF